jgi:hypothetical protein
MPSEFAALHVARHTGVSFPSWGGSCFLGRQQKATILSIQEYAMRKVLRGYAKDKDGNLILIGTMPVPHSKDKSSPRERKDKRHLVRQGATIFKKETVG